MWTIFWEPLTCMSKFFRLTEITKPENSKCKYLRLSTYFDTIMTAEPLTPVGFTATRKGFDGSSKDTPSIQQVGSRHYSQKNRLCHFSILQEPFPSAWWIMSSVSSKNKAQHWQVHNTLHHRFLLLLGSQLGQTCQQANQFELSVHDETPRVILNLQASRQSPDMEV